MALIASTAQSLKEQIGYVGRGQAYGGKLLSDCGHDLMNVDE